MEIEKAFKKLLIKNPFYGLFCLSLPKVITTKVNTLAVSKNGINCQLNINPDFWTQFSDDEQIALLQHELSHIALQHMFLWDYFPDKQALNLAADAEVNSYIQNLPKSAITASLISQSIGKHLDNGLGTKRYYEEIIDYHNKQQQQAQTPQKPCNGGQGGNDSSQDSQSQSSESSSLSKATPNEESDDNEQKEKSTPPSPPQDSNQEQQEKEEKEEEGGESEQQYSNVFEDVESYDDHSTWKSFKDVPEATQQLMKNTINRILVSTAEQVEKMHGTIPGELQVTIEKLREKKPEVFNWKAYFRRLLGSIYDVNIKSTRRKESKRFEGAAGIQHKKKVSILVAIDTSGSVSEKELQEFFSEIDYVYKAGARVTIIQCDTMINSIDDYDGRNLPKITGRGGTDFNPPVDYYVEHIREYASLVYFTDGYASLPNKTPQGMVWIISSRGCHQDYPGKTIYIPKNNNH